MGDERAIVCTAYPHPVARGDGLLQGYTWQHVDLNDRQTGKIPDGVGRFVEVEPSTIVERGSSVWDGVQELTVLGYRARISRDVDVSVGANYPGLLRFIFDWQSQVIFWRWVVDHARWIFCGFIQRLCFHPQFFGRASAPRQGAACREVGCKGRNGVLV